MKTEVDSRRSVFQGVKLAGRISEKLGWIERMELLHYHYSCCTGWKKWH